MLVKNVHKYFPSSIFEGFIAMESIGRKFAEISTIKRINAITLIAIRRVFKLREFKRLLFF